MKQFAELFIALDQTTKTSVKTKALAEYFTSAPEDDRVWTIAIFSGRRPKRAVTTTLLREWAAETAGLPLWLVEESYAVVGDLAETLALILPPAQAQSNQTLSHWIKSLREMPHLDVEARKARILQAWQQLEATERLVFNKLITGGFRLGVSRKLMTRALAEATGEDSAALAHRLMGHWDPATTSFQDLTQGTDDQAALSRPYPFCLAHGLDTAPHDLGPPDDWQAEWKWDGIRGQVILRGGELFTWSRGEELMTDRFPEFRALTDWLPDGTVLDGEILGWADDRPLPFADLQKRIGRKSVPRSLLQSVPVRLVAYDLLEWQGQDLRDRPLSVRRQMLEQALAALPAAAPVHCAPLLEMTGWDDLAATRGHARAHRAEGVMIKRCDSLYRAGRHRGDWWKWKLDPLTVDAVMIYAQAGHGRRATLYTDFTFAVWDGDALVPFAKAYSGLTDAEFREISTWVRRNTQQRFGPVRQVTPELVFELAFEGIHRSTRHKSGIALRFPRMLRWRRDKPAAEANSLSDLHALLDATP